MEKRLDYFYRKSIYVLLLLFRSVLLSVSHFLERNAIRQFVAIFFFFRLLNRLNLSHLLIHILLRFLLFSFIMAHYYPFSIRFTFSLCISETTFSCLFYSVAAGPFLSFQMASFDGNKWGSLYTFVTVKISCTSFHFSISR